MSVLVVAYSVVVPVPVLERKYRGGLRRYRLDCPNRTFCADEHLTSVAFLQLPDVDAFLAHLGRLGLIHIEDGHARDVVVVDQLHGPLSRCSWIEGGRYPRGYSAVWRQGTQPGRIALPDGWTLEKASQLTRVPDDELEVRLLKVGQGDQLETYLDLKTGKLLHGNRTRPPGDVA
jgi:hypothetical protein